MPIKSYVGKTFGDSGPLLPPPPPVSEGLNTYSPNLSADQQVTDAFLWSQHQSSAVNYFVSSLSHLQRNYI